ncbi:hypothetical protein C8Q74DRAFT_1280758 [Fomes fomentarius]|nr:hypothetical protein C8Q74DRAFT_1280758 [Fomes fomentarius]
MSDGDTIFLLEGPTLNPYDIEQYKSVCLASLIRHARRARGQTNFCNEDAQVKPGRAPNKRRLSQTGAQEDAISETREEKRAKLGDAHTSPAFATPEMLTALPPNPRASFSSPMPSNRHRRFMSLLGRTRVPLLDPIAAKDALKRRVSRTDRKTLISMDSVSLNADGSFVMYTLPVVMSPSSTSPVDLLGCTGTVYRLLVDSGDSSFWFYADEFTEILPFFEDDPIGCPQSDDPHTADALAHETIPRGPDDLVVETAKQGYLDGGVIHLARWSNDMPFLVPGWNWQMNTPEPEATLLKFPRILVTSASNTTAAQPVDGNLGLAVPGFRAPWRESKVFSSPGEDRTENVTATDRLTFFDIITHGHSNAPRITNPRQLTIRLLVPDKMQQERCLERMKQSFLYYGRGFPCGIPSDDGKMFLPVYTPQLHIFPAPRTGSTPVYDMWRLRLLSMTLLEPAGPDLNYEVLVQEQWSARRIPIDHTPGSSLPGVPVCFDTGSGASVLPKKVVQDIWERWFEQPASTFPPPIDGIVLPIWHNRPDNFANHDLVFEFMDSCGEVFDFRCSAEHVLSAPWKVPGTTATSSLFQPAAEDHPFEDSVLGVNFFWAAFVKLDSDRGGAKKSGDTSPTLQFAAQRIVHNGQVVAGPYDIGLYENLSPRLQALASNQPEIYSNTTRQY